MKNTLTLRKLISSLTLSSFMGSTMLLSGCMGEASSPLKSSLAPQGRLTDSNRVKDNNQTIPILTNVAAKDGVRTNSRVYLVFQNSTWNGVEFVGCDNVTWAKAHITDYVPINSQPVTTTAYSAKWDKLFNREAGIIDGKYLQDESDGSYVEFHDVPDHGIMNCYFNIQDDNTGKTITQKVTFTADTIATNGVDTINPQLEDSKNDQASLGTSLESLKKLSTSNLAWNDYNARWVAAAQDSADALGGRGRVRK